MAALTVAEMIAALRGAGMTIEEIAAAVGTGGPTVSSWEAGRVKKPRAATLARIENLHASVVGGGPAGDRPGVPQLPGFGSDPAAGAAAAGPVPTAAAGDQAAPAPQQRPRRATVADQTTAAAPPADRRAVPPPRQPGERFRFIHCADLHIDSPLAGLQKIDDGRAAWIQTATRRAFARLVDMAIADRVDFVVIAGDLYDGDWKSADTGFFVRRQLLRLSAAGIPVFAIAGNHDALSLVSRSFRWPEGTHHFGGTAGSREVPGLNVVVHGRSFGDRHESRDFVESYPSARPGVFNVGILHTSLAGATGHGDYAPCSPPQLAGRGYDYWALGHVHVPRIVQAGPHIVYSGNIQGRGVDETGPRGCYVVTVDDTRRPDAHFVPLDDVRWERIAVPVGGVAGASADSPSDAAGPATVDDVVAAAIDALEAALPGDDALLAARVVLTGSTSLHRRLVSRRGSLRADISATIEGQLHNRVWLEKILVETVDSAPAPRPQDGVPRRARELLDDEFRRLLDTDVDVLLAEHPDLRTLFDSLQPLDQASPGRRDELQAPAAWAQAVEDARALLAAEFGDLDGPPERSP